ncbi:sensor histidine kinase [Dyadobacter crusticola]|uniref:sensor histidine kinase n=1 Tax=Dyadobacter crusticola TaxID=292407 RepID=UPI00068CEE9F|nr:histidine kinase [Dyadobacter crusticola]
MMTKDKIIRFSLHLLTWLLTWATLRYFSIPTLTKDNLDVVWHASGIILIQSMAVFYLLGYVVFPRFLYPKRLLLLAICLLVIFQIIHISNYYEVKYLASISNDKSGKGLIYITKFWLEFLKPKPWTSCFTEFRVAYVDYAWSLFYVTPILAIKVMRDVISLRTQNLRLERDWLVSEKNNLDLKSQSLQLQRDNLNLELSFLKSQINPHFLFNTLNAIYAKTADIDEQAADLVLRLASLMRYSLYESNREKVVLSKEVEYIESYIELEKNRFAEKVNIDYTLEGDPDRYFIAPLLLISFVENAFKHGVSRSVDNAYVKISIILDGPSLFFSVKNSVHKGAPGVKKTAEQPGGFGILNTTKRLELLYPKRHQFTVFEEEDAFQIDLRLDLATTGVMVN